MEPAFVPLCSLKEQRIRRRDGLGFGHMYVDKYAFSFGKQAVECMHRAALTCGGENWYLEANSSGITPKKLSQNGPRRADCGSLAAVRTRCFFTVFPERYPEGLLGVPL